MGRYTQEQHQKRYDNYHTALKRWFSSKRWAIAYNILSNNGEEGISLRLLEFLTSRYAHSYPVEYYIENPNGSRRFFNLFHTLQEHQRTKRKKNIEPFARANKDVKNEGRFDFGLEDKIVTTTVAQLMFLRFIVENQVQKWLHVHLDKVIDAKRNYERERVRMRSIIQHKRAVRNKKRKQNSNEDEVDEREVLLRRQKRNRRHYKKTIGSFSVRDVTHTI